MTDQPRTAAGRRLVAEQRDPCAIYTDDPGAEDWRDWALREVLAIEAEAAALDVERLYQAMKNTARNDQDPSLHEWVEASVREYARLASATRPPLPPPGSGRSKEIGRRIHENFKRLASADEEETT